MKLSSDGSLVSHSAGLGRCAVSGLRDPCYSNVKEVVKTLLDAGVGIGAFQTEGYRGQLEIALKPQPPIRAVDQLIVVHDTLKCFFARQGLMATMSPRPVKALQQSAGQHTHVSINPPNIEASFLAGTLRMIPELCAFFSHTTCPTSVSGDTSRDISSRGGPKTAPCLYGRLRPAIGSCVAWMPQPTCTSL